MTIEAQLERIAAALEALVTNQGIVADAPPPQQELPLDDDDDLEEEEEDDLDDMEDDDLDDDLDDDDDELEEEAPPPKKKTKKKTAKKKPRAKKKKAKKTKIGKDDNAESEYTAEEVRSKLKDLQLATGSAAQVKSIMKKNGASTFGQLKVGRYDQVVAAVDKLLEDE